MTLIIADPVDNPLQPIDRPFDQRERSLLPQERLAFIANSIGDLKKSADLQAAIFKAFDAGEDHVRLGRALMIDVNEERANAARENFARIELGIERLSGSVAELCAEYGVTIQGKPAYGRIVVDGGL
jgi:hypothetical protein